MKQNNVAKVIVSLLAVIGFLTAAIVTVDYLYKKYRKTLKSLNEQDTLEGLDDKCFTESDDADEGVDCAFDE